ncbi:unnamed protein product, partial [marine sediment metagenome]
INTLVGFQNHISASCPPFRDVILFGNGGGISVVAADLFAQCGLSIAEFDGELKCRLKALDIGQGASMENPIDIPANALTRNPSQTIGELFNLVCRYQPGSALVCHLNIPVLAVYDRIDLLEDVINVIGKIRKSRNLTVHLVLRSDQDPANETLRNHLRVCANNEDIPTFDELSESAAVLNQISVYELYHRRRP